MKCGRFNIPSCGTVKTGQAGLRKIYTVWTKIMDKEGSLVWVYVHAQDHNVWNIYKGRLFHLETVIVYNFSPLFWAQSGFDMFL